MLNGKEEVQIPGQQYEQSYAKPRTRFSVMTRAQVLCGLKHIPCSGHSQVLNNGLKSIFGTPPHVLLYIGLTAVSRHNRCHSHNTEDETAWKRKEKLDLQRLGCENTSHVLCPNT